MTRHTYVARLLKMGQSAVAIGVERVPERKPAEKLGRRKSVQSSKKNRAQRGPCASISPSSSGPQSQEVSYTSGSSCVPSRALSPFPLQSRATLSVFPSPSDSDLYQGRAHAWRVGAHFAHTLPRAGRHITPQKRHTPHTVVINSSTRQHQQDTSTHHGLRPSTLDFNIATLLRI